MLNSLRKKIEVPDIGNPENLTREERLSRLLHHRMISRKQLKTYSDDRIFEHFLVVGVPAKETLKFKRESRSIPHVLYQYPKDKPLEALRIAQFLFPDGVRAKSRPQSASHSDLFEALYAQQHLKHPEDSHAFLLTTETKEILYGVCITRQEPVNVSQRVYDVDFSTGTVNDLVASDTVVLAYQSYCFISKFPFFELHFSVLKQILGIQHMQTAKYQFDDIPSSDPLGAQLLNNKQENGSASPKHDISNNAVLQSTSPIKDVLDVYHKTKIPHPNEDLYLQLSPHLEQIHFHRAAQWDDADGFLRFGLAVTFAHFPKELIVQILSAIMLEKRIVFFCSNMRMLSSIVVSFVALMRPFIYQSVFLPVIPQSLQVVYTAPVPFVVGATTMPKESELYDELLVVDIAAKSFILPPSVTIPLIPQSKVLLNKLDAPLKKLTRIFSHNYPNNLPYNPSNEELEQVFTLASIFQTHLSNLFQNFKSHTITDVSDYSNPISVFLKENFMLIEFADSEEDQEFMKMFMDTQMFFDFSDKQLQQKDKDLQQKDKEAKR